VLEIIKGRQREQVALNELTSTSSELSAEPDDAEERIGCLRTCLNALSIENRQLITEYYEGEKGDKIQNEKNSWKNSGFQSTPLRMRALRLRDRLQGCVEECLSRA
jgi:hypothetical protein